jgi:hydroxysqualene synthase
LLNHLQDCGTDMRTLDRCYLPQTLMRHFRVQPRDLLEPAETPGLRRVFITVLDRVDRLNLAAEELPYLVRGRRLRAETTFICRLATRLADRLSKADPLAARVALTRTDTALSLLRAMGALVWR